MAELFDVARAVAEAAKPGEQVEAYVARGRSTSIRVYEQEIESLSSAESAGLGVRVVVGGRVGFAWVASLDEASAKEALSEARDNASFASVDEFAGLPAPDGVSQAPVDVWSDALDAVATEDKVSMALELERLTRAGDPRIRQVTYCDYSDSLSESCVVSSLGVEASTRRTTCFVSSYAVAGDGEETQTGYGYSAGRSVSEVSVAEAAADAVDRATRLLGAKKPPTSRLTVIFEPRITAVLLGILAGTLSGDEVGKGRSLFADRLGEEVAVSRLALIDDPTNALAWGASGCDAEGLACRRNTLIEGGKLLGYLYDTRSGREAGCASTGSAVRGGFRTTPGVGARAVALEPGELSCDEIVARVGSGLLVQSVIGVHSGVNPVSGDFSVGAEGVMVRDGAVAEPVREITVASSIQRMLHHVEHIGGDLEWLPGSAAGVTLAISDMAMSGA